MIELWRGHGLLKGVHLRGVQARRSGRLGTGKPHPLTKIHQSGGHQCLSTESEWIDAQGIA